MNSLRTECERRLRHGIPLRLDQTTGLLERGINASMVEQDIEDELEPSQAEESIERPPHTWGTQLHLPMSSL